MAAAEFLMIFGRMLIGGIFVVAGVRHLFILPTVTAPMAARGIPRPGQVLITGSIFEAFAGLMVIFGFYAGWVALGLVAFTLIASWIILDFWNKDGFAREGAINGWIANIGVVGGLLIVAAQGF
ncbi:putative oxidoreductase [Neorhizobium galegae]|uniref:DoxX family protein n=1 Tax=Neorhizobium galegae TaxID=399 RepID=UPI002781F268|nr:DoxX family protein [Neorhizobium galegae]MDQ0135630.1 putative oxidoreductase [Neorhizobium galegae]